MIEILELENFHFVVDHLELDGRSPLLHGDDGFRFRHGDGADQHGFVAELLSVLHNENDLRRADIHLAAVYAYGERCGIAVLLRECHAQRVIGYDILIQRKSPLLMLMKVSACPGRNFADICDKLGMIGVILIAVGCRHPFFDRRLVGGTPCQEIVLRRIGIVVRVNGEPHGLRRHGERIAAVRARREHLIFDALVVCKFHLVDDTVIGMRKVHLESDHVTLVRPVGQSFDGENIGCGRCLYGITRTVAASVAAASAVVFAVLLVAGGDGHRKHRDKA